MVTAKGPDDFELMAAFQRARAREQDERDLYDAAAGRETGRIRKPNFQDRKQEAETRRKQREQSAVLTALARMLADPVYAARYESFGIKLREAEAQAEQALAAVEAELVDARNDLQHIEESANRLPDGRLVFRSEDGRIVDADGQVIGEDEAATILWNENAQSYEQYLEVRRRAEEVQARVEAIRRYMIEVLGYARDRWEDENNPITEEEMDELEDLIRAQKPEWLAEAPSPAEDVAQQMPAGIPTYGQPTL